MAGRLPHLAATDISQKQRVLRRDPVAPNSAYRQRVAMLALIQRGIRTPTGTTVLPVTYSELTMNLPFLLGAFLITCISLWVLRPIAAKVGLVDIPVPGGRKSHLNETPLVGGLGIFVGILCISFLASGTLSEFSSLLSLSALVLFIGTVDDAKELTVLTRLIGHVLIALTMAVVAGVQLLSLGDLLALGVINLGFLAIPVTIFSTVGVINAINMIDGLTGALVIVALGFIAVLTFRNDQADTTGFIVILIFAIMAFLSFNFRRPIGKKALVYLGDAGSTMLGFILAWLLITETQGESASFPPVYALWFLAVPLFDTVNLLIKRPFRGNSPFNPAVDHLHHNLLSRGFTVAQVVSLLTAAALLLGGIGLAGFILGASESIMFLSYIALFILYFLYSDRVRASDEFEN